MKLTSFLLLIACLQVSARTKAQTVTLSLKNVSLEKVFTELKKQTGYNFVYNNSLLERANKVTVTAKKASLQEVLEICFVDQPLSYSILERTIVVKPKVPGPNEKAIATISDPPPPMEIRGRVTNENGEPLEGVTVTLLGNKKGTTTDRRGEFKLDIDADRARVTITSVGFAPVTFSTQGKTLSVEPQHESTQGVTENNARSSASMDQNGLISVKLVRLIREEGAVVITGIVNKRKESFTGSAATYTQKELLQVGGTNILQSLKTLDPSFGIRDNVQFGSDPNRLPDIEIRGKTTLLGERDELGLDPNQPLFILDGFESSLKTINDLDINRIESITILKDAASTAIYGSKAANGVVVVETVKPKAGKLQVNYSSRFNISAPDLTSYNLMNAAEKLEFELLSGRFDPIYSNATSPTEAELKMAELYNNRLRLLAEGVNTYWLSAPLRVGIDQNHSVSVAGGEGNFLFSLNGSYNGITGVMKESERKRYQGNMNLIYRTSKLQFSNNFSVLAARSRNPIVNFSTYAMTNPYHKKTNNGVIEPWLENTATSQVQNPLWNATRNSRDIGKDMQFTNFFTIEWRPSKSWMVRARAGLTLNDDESEIFSSPEDHQWAGTDINRRGRFTYTNTKAFQSEGNLTVTYAKVINKNRITLTGSSNINSGNSVLQGYSATGFSSAGNFTYPNFSRGYPEAGAPTYRDNISRSLDALFNGGYAFNDRYLVDLSLRSSGSSVFGNSRRFNNTWSVGLGWNLHREQFISNLGWINFLKIRGSVGNPGNQNFGAQRALITYQYNPNIRSYFGLAAQPNQLGNPDLEWQITRDKNIGMDLTAFNSRFSLSVDYFHKLTDPLLITINLPLSSGSAQVSGPARTFTNAGEQIGQGLNFSTSYHILRNTQRRILWSIRATGRTQKQRIDGIGNKLESYNKAGRGANLVRFADGSDPDDLWAIRSYGIDPASGRELFLTKDGKFTFDHAYEHEVIVGNTRPDLDGIVGSNLILGGFTVNVNFRYQFGAEVFNSAVLNKVENVNFLVNQDRRALYDRWQKPGDIRYFKNIRDNQTFSPISSRFVQTENTFTLESIYAEYQFSGGWVKKAGLGNFRVFASARDIFRFSTMQAERGTDYPFARVFDTGLSFNF